VLLIQHEDQRQQKNGKPAAKPKAAQAAKKPA